MDVDNNGSIDIKGIVSYFLSDDMDEDDLIMMFQSKKKGVQLSHANGKDEKDEIVEGENIGINED